MQRSIAVLLVSVALAATPSVRAQDTRARVFVEESERLPADSTAAISVTTDGDFVDVDGDGDLDLYVTEGTSGPASSPDRLLLNDGTGRFGDASASRLLTSNDANGSGSDWSDVDGDGDLDAIVANVGQEELLLNDGRGFFSSAPAGQIPLYPGNPSVGDFDVTSDANFADVDCDGDEDLLLANENPFAPGQDRGAQNRLYLNVGSGYFEETELPRAPGTGDQSVATLVGDVNRDGAPDIVVLNRGQERILLGNCSGAFVDETASRIQQVDPTGSDVSWAVGGALADLDRDGDLDLIVANGRSQPIEYYANNGRGEFVTIDFRNPPRAGELDTGLVLVDFDLDGDLDVHVTTLDGPNRYFRNRGNGRFRDRTDRHFAAQENSATAAAFGDVDDDGDLDLFVGNSRWTVNGGGEFVGSGVDRLFVNRRRARR